MSLNPSPRETRQIERLGKSFRQAESWVDNIPVDPDTARNVILGIFKSDSAPSHHIGADMWAGFNYSDDRKEGANIGIPEDSITGRTYLDQLAHAISRSSRLPDVIEMGLATTRQCVQVAFSQIQEDIRALVEAKTGEPDLQKACTQITEKNRSENASGVLQDFEEALDYAPVDFATVKDDNDDPLQIEARKQYHHLIVTCAYRKPDGEIKTHRLNTNSTIRKQLKAHFATPVLPTWISFQFETVEGKKKAAVFTPEEIIAPVMDDLAAS